MGKGQVENRMQKSEKKLTSNIGKKGLHASMVLSALFGSNQFISDNTNSLPFCCVKVKN